MNDLDQNDYDEWNAEYHREHNTCPGCGQQHKPSLDCDGQPLGENEPRPPPPKGGAPSSQPPPAQQRHTAAVPHA